MAGVEENLQSVRFFSFMKKLKKHEEKTKKIESQNLQSSLNKLEIGFEPTTPSLRVKCSTD